MVLVVYGPLFQISSMRMPTAYMYYHVKSLVSPRMKVIYKLNIISMGSTELYAKNSGRTEK